MILNVFMIGNYVCKIIFHTFKQHVVTINKLSHSFEIFLEILTNNFIHFLMNI